MKIRSITYFCNPYWPLDESRLYKAGQFLGQAKSAYETSGYEVQTTRLATIPFPKLLGKTRLEDLPKLASEMERLIKEVGISYACLGPALLEFMRSYEVIPDALSATQNIFFAGITADNLHGINMDAIRACAQVIVKSSHIEENGFANLRFAALANVASGSPFFPAAYWDKDEPAFAIATEAADLAVDAFAHSQSLDAGRMSLVAEIERNGTRISDTARQLELMHHCKFGGIDFSLAPFPEEARSIGRAFEVLGVKQVGLHGAFAAAAILTETIDRAKFPRAGFNGLFMPVLEDAILSQRAAETSLTLKDLLLYSAACGTGLDTVPLPGDTSADQITALLLDLGVLALRLDKPLTARLMPVPGKKAGEITSFDFSYFAGSRIMELDAKALTGHFSSERTIQLKPRQSNR